VNSQPAFNQGSAPSRTLARALERAARRGPGPLQVKPAEARAYISLARNTINLKSACKSSEMTEPPSQCQLCLKLLVQKRSARTRHGLVVETEVHDEIS
jgi:hypothetical protein